jgi:hypothetical protein
LELATVVATFAVVPIAFGVGCGTIPLCHTLGLLLTGAAAVLVPASLVVVVQVLQEWENMKKKNI